MEDSTISFNNDEQDVMNNEYLTGSSSVQFERKAEQPTKIKVIGVGGGGGNAVNHMFRHGIHGVDFIVCNTDAKALSASPVPNKIELGKLGAGNIPERAKKAALEHEEEIRTALSDNTQMVFITAGMGGGTGTGAAPVIAKIAKDIELNDVDVPRILVVAIVTMPFSFEGSTRKRQAEAGIKELEGIVDAILVINNDKLREIDGNLTLNEAFSRADDILLTAAKGIAEIITVSGHVNVDFRDVNTVMENSGTALMGAGVGKGENRAHDAIVEATTSVLLNDNDIRGTKQMLLYFSYNKNHQITMDELGEVTDYITKLTGDPDTNIIWGDGDDDTLDDELRITLVATGFVKKSGPRTISLDSTTKPIDTDTKPTTPEKPVEDKVTDSPAESEKPQPVDNSDPFNILPATVIGDKRYLSLDAPIEEDELEESEMSQQAEDPVMITSDNSHINDIRVISREIAEQTRHEENKTPDFIITPTEAMMSPDVPESNSSVRTEPTVFTQTVERPATSLTSGAFTSDNLDDIKTKERAERIKQINHMLHADPDGGRKLEEMPADQLTDKQVYHTENSAESDAARTHINPDGTRRTEVSFLDKLFD